MTYGRKGHYLKSSSSYTVVVLASLRHGACVQCNKTINSLQQAYRHWDWAMGYCNCPDYIVKRWKPKNFQRAKK